MDASMLPWLFSNSPMRRSPGRRVQLPGSIAPRFAYPTATALASEADASGSSAVASPASATTGKKLAFPNGDPKAFSGNILSRFMALGGHNAGSLDAIMSDARVKEDKRKVAETKDGLDIYAFRYLGDPAMHLGLMAQQVQTKRPAAVRRRQDGLLMVDYAKALKGK